MDLCQMFPFRFFTAQLKPVLLNFRLFFVSFIISCPFCMCFKLLTLEEVYCTIKFSSENQLRRQNLFIKHFKTIIFQELIFNLHFIKCFCMPTSLFFDLLHNHILQKSDSLASFFKQYIKQQPQLHFFCCSQFYYCHLKM